MLALPNARRTHNSNAGCDEQDRAKDRSQSWWDHRHPSCVLPGSAHGRQYFCAPRFARSRVLGSARVSRVGDSESFRESRTSSCRSKSESDVEIHGSDACAPNYSRGLRPWRRSRARPRCRMGSRSGRWSGCRCRRRWLVSERAAEFVHASLAAGAHESA